MLAVRGRHASSIENDPGKRCVPRAMCMSVDSSLSATARRALASFGGGLCVEVTDEAIVVPAPSGAIQRVLGRTLADEIARIAELCRELPGIRLVLLDLGPRRVRF